MIATTPTPPYYAVIFTSVRKDEDPEYSKMSGLMLDLAKEQPGFLGVESAREDVGITVSYWQDTLSIKNWKQHTDHLLAQKKGREQWYKHYRVRIAKVEREYGFDQ